MKSKLKTLILTFTLILSLFSLAAFTACNAPHEDVTITISRKEMQLTEGQTAQLTVSVTPTDPVDKNVDWKTSDNKIVTVENGKITAVAKGEATVTATTNGKSDSCKVTVVAAGEGGNSAGNNASDGG